MQHAPGKNFIRVPGILYIIFSGFLIFGNSAMISGLLFPSGNLARVGGLSVQDGVLALSNTTGPQEVPAAMASFVIAAFVVMIVVSAIDLIIGIIAVLNANKPEKAKTVVTVSYILIALAVLSFIIALISAFMTGASIMIDLIVAAGQLATGLVLPILILVGGKKNQAYARNLT